MAKIIARKTIDKKDILIPGCESPCWWNKYPELILVVLVRKTRFLLVIISFPIIFSLFMDPLRMLA